MNDHVNIKYYADRDQFQNQYKISYLKSKSLQSGPQFFSIQYSRNANDVGSYIGSSGSVDLLSNIVIG